MAHAPFAPSSASRWLKCTASYGASLHLPDPPDSAYAAEGTRLHDLAAAVLEGGMPELMGLAEVSFLAPYINWCQDRMHDEWHEIENTIPHSPLLFGTPDFVAQVRNTLHVVDLKTGAGVMVSPVENDQMLAYAYMVLARYRDGPAKPPKHVMLTIVQPTDEARPVKSWETTTEHVMAWGERAEQVMADTVSGKSHEYVAGEHCRWCKAKPVCPKLRGAMVAMPQGLDVAELSPDLTAEVLDRADIVLQFIDAVRAHGHDLALRGVTVPGWTLKPKRSMRSWANPVEVIDWARANRQMTTMTEPRLLTPAQLEKADKALYEKVADKAVAVSSGTNLVRGNSPVQVALPPTASDTERLMANFETLKYRK